MKNDNEPRRKSDEKRKRKKFESDYDEDPFFRGKMKKRPQPAPRRNRYCDDSEWE